MAPLSGIDKDWRNRPTNTAGTQAAASRTAPTAAVAAGARTAQGRSIVRPASAASDDWAWFVIDTMSAPEYDSAARSISPVLPDCDMATSVVSLAGGYDAYSQVLGQTRRIR